MQIRHARESDLDEAARLWRERAALLRQTEPDPQPMQSSETWRQRALRRLQKDETACFVAIKDAVLIGFIMVGIDADALDADASALGKLHDMALDLHQAHQGLGTGLLMAARTWLTERGVQTLVVNAPANYPVEAAFWRAQGGPPRFLQYWLRT